MRRLFARKVEVAQDSPAEYVADGARWKQLEKPEWWRPEPGEVLICNVLGISERTGTWGTYGVVMVRVKKELMRITGSVLVSILQCADVEPDDTIRIVYLGTKQGRASGRTFHDYSVFVREKG